ncbi:hypothetical protein [Streptomyces sp. NRRL F-2799]|uniref:hypothetical protein n=1 Tax=Streptomyces sp. NRRL F-2799 TaxID=1463844 RepID=UPI0004C4ED56|nr:hypothetical protein [Streptomyces sp. NRRL F-2799]
MNPAAAKPVDTHHQIDRMNHVKHCEPTAAGSDARRTGATEACVSVRRAAPDSARSAGTARAAQAAPSNQSLAADSAGCALAAPGVHTYDRFPYCGSGASDLFTVRDDLVDTDTCADFPLAATREGGKDGAQCTDIVPSTGSADALHPAQPTEVQVADGYDLQLHVCPGSPEHPHLALVQ